MEFITPVSMQSGYIPPDFEAFRIPLAQVFTQTTDNLTVISQKIFLENYDVNFHIFDSKGRAIIRPQSKKDILTIHYMLQGNIDAVLRRGVRVQLKHNEYNMFQLPTHKHYALVDKGVYWCFHIDIHPHHQSVLRDELLMFKFFQDALKESGGIINLRPYTILGRENFLITKVLNYKETGPEAEKGLSSIIDNLIWEFCTKYTNEIDACFSGKEFSNQQLANVVAVKTYLTNNLAHSHDIKWVANQFLITPGELESIFFQIFGQRFSEYYTNQRLSRVYSMLANRSLTLESIARLMGYDSLISLQEAFYGLFETTMEEIRAYHRKNAGTDD